MLVLVVYDVSSNRLRRRLARLLGGYGERVQRSAFECRLRRRERRELVRRLRSLLDRSPEADTNENDLADGELPACSVRLYPLATPGTPLELGRGLHPSAGEVLIA